MPYARRTKSGHNLFQDRIRNAMGTTKILPPDHIMNLHGAKLKYIREKLFDVGQTTLCRMKRWKDTVGETKPNNVSKFENGNRALTEAEFLKRDLENIAKFAGIHTRYMHEKVSLKEFQKKIDQLIDEKDEVQTEAERTTAQIDTLDDTITSLAQEEVLSPQDVTDKKYSRGKVYYESGDLISARKEFDSVLKNTDNPVCANYYLALINIQEDLPFDAMREFTLAFKNNQDLPVERYKTLSDKPLFFLTRGLGWLSQVMYNFNISEPENRNLDEEEPYGTRKKADVEYYDKAINDLWKCLEIGTSPKYAKVLLVIALLNRAKFICNEFKPTEDYSYPDYSQVIRDTCEAIKLVAPNSFNLFRQIKWTDGDGYSDNFLNTPTQDKEAIHKFTSEYAREIEEIFEESIATDATRYRYARPIIFINEGESRGYSNFLRRDFKLGIENVYDYFLHMSDPVNHYSERGLILILNNLINLDPSRYEAYMGLVSILGENKKYFEKIMQVLSNGMKHCQYSQCIMYAQAALYEKNGFIDEAIASYNGCQHLFDEDEECAFVDAPIATMIKASLARLESISPPKT